MTKVVFKGTIPSTSIYQPSHDYVMLNGDLDPSSLVHQSSFSIQLESDPLLYLHGSFGCGVILLSK
jgi:hypothetical protein